MISREVIKPRNCWRSSMRGSFSTRYCSSIFDAWLIVQSAEAVTSLSNGVIISCTNFARCTLLEPLASTKRTSRVVTIPSRRPRALPSWVTRIEPTPWVRINFSNSVAEALDRMQYGSSITYDSARLTRRIISTCSSWDINRWMIPIPPLRAISMAIAVSVTVSMLDEMIGLLIAMFRVSCVFKETLRRLRTGLCLGTRSTSS
mmetsp:Transcript_454/g.612  ORF Transcript_454/g.612 Transcript_454/m.612 type:complete len:203 (+) Transcript_454:861-1469(+)